MYSDPVSYGFHPGEYERFTDEKRYNAVKRYQPDRACLCFDWSAAELSSYPEILRSVGICCRIVNGICVLTAEDFGYIKSYSYLPKRKRENAVPIDTVLKMFKKSSLAFYENADGAVTVINEKHTNMFEAMSALAKAADNSIKNPVSKSLKYFFAVNYDYLEYRQITVNISSKESV